MEDNSPYVVWTFNRWYPPRPTDRPYGPQMEELTIRSCINERASGVFSINSVSDNPLWFRILMTDLKGDSTIDSHSIQIVKAVYLQDQVGNVTADPLVPLNDAGEVLVPPKGREHFWVFTHTKSMSAGTYRGNLIIQSFSGPPSLIIPVNLEIFPVTLPDNVPISTFTWDHFEEYRGELYNAGQLPDTEGQEGLYMEDLVRNGVNTFLIHHRLLPWPKEDSSLDLDFTLFDRAVRRKKGKGALVLECSLVGDRLGLKCGLQFGSEKWDRVFTQWIGALIAHLGELGVKPDECAFSFFSLDKRDDWETVEQLCHVAPLVRAIAPEVNIFVDYGYKDPECRFDYHTEALKKVLPFVDIVAVPYKRLQNEKELSLLRNSKKHIWGYTSNHYGYDHLIHSRNICAYECYRIPLWSVFDQQLNGAAVYSSTRWRGDPWNDWYFADNALTYDDVTHENCTVYNGARGPITSRRWEAWRMGLDDYKCLHMLREAAAHAKDREKYETLIRKACREVTEKSSSPEQASEWRWRIIEAILELRS